MPKTLAGDDWVLMDPVQELMILDLEGDPMAFPSREAAIGYLETNS